LAQAVPTVRDTRRATLPKALAPTQLRQLLAAVDPSSPVGRRDRAMLVCLASLGLRAKEVAELSLDAIDWRAGTLTVATSKTRRAHRLPLPTPVGRAIATYLRSGRPRTTVRRVFVRHLAPIGAPLTSTVVIGAVRRAFLRSGLDVASRGAHTLRHTAATAMVRAGVSLKAVADVLGHRSLDTTALYTKVDLPRLRDVARPWPEEVVS
jgi:site-specific recombinase XerD